ncbi:MAG: regulatory protein RecX [Bacteroidetes bacterium]|nr:regulatory protein RecX [Bacteroidota bacterium]
MYSIKPLDNLSNIQHKLEYFCDYQERCIYDVDQKLRSWKVSPDSIQLIMQRLQEEKFIDEERFARAFVRGKFHINKWGKIKIIVELRRRNIPEKLIKNALNEISADDYLNTIRELALRKKQEIITQKSLNIREKIITFVTGKGFEYNLTEKILTELNISNDYT